jgi:hypothetical protein
VDTRDELFAICVPFEGLCVDKPSKRLAGVSHSFRTTFLPWAGVASVIAADDVAYGSRPLTLQFSDGYRASLIAGGIAAKTRSRASC